MQGVSSSEKPGRTQSAGDVPVIARVSSEHRRSGSWSASAPERPPTVRFTVTRDTRFESLPTSSWQEFFQGASKLLETGVLAPEQAKHLISKIVTLNKERDIDGFTNMSGKKEDAIDCTKELTRACKACANASPRAKEVLFCVVQDLYNGTEYEWLDIILVLLEGGYISKEDAEAQEWIVEAFDNEWDSETESLAAAVLRLTLKKELPKFEDPTNTYAADAFVAYAKWYLDTE